jgi:hypothetical protein
VSRRHPRLPIRQTHHRAIPTLLRQELEHIRGSDLEQVLADQSEERLQFESRRPQRVRPSPSSDELQVPVNQRIAEPIPHHARPRDRAHQQRKSVITAG